MLYCLDATALQNEGYRDPVSSSRMWIKVLHAPSAEGPLGNFGGSGLPCCAANPWLDSRIEVPEANNPDRTASS